MGRLAEEALLAYDRNQHKAVIHDFKLHSHVGESLELVSDAPIVNELGQIRDESANVALPGSRRHDSLQQRASYLHRPGSAMEFAVDVDGRRATSTREDREAHGENHTRLRGGLAFLLEFWD